MPKVSPQQIRDVSEAIIQDVDKSIVLPNSVSLAVNLVFDKVLGRAVLRKGTTLLGTQVSSGNSCLALNQFVSSSGDKIPLVQFDTVLYDYDSGAWGSSKTGLNASKMRFVTFLDTIAGINGTDTIASTSGTSWSTSGTALDIGDCPAGNLIIEWKDKVYVAGVSGNPDRLYYSSTPTGGAITWGTNYIDIEPEDGAGNLTGLAKVPGYLLLFKERSLKRWNGDSTFPEDLVDVGCPSQEAIVQTRQSVFYFNEKGVFETIGGYPRKVSRRIQALIEAIPVAYLSTVSGWGDKDNVYFSIGDITLNDLTLTNVIIQYNLDSQIWTTHSTPNEMVFWGKYIDTNGGERVLAGDDDGNVWQMFYGTTDNGSAIDYRLRFQPQELATRSRLKDLSDIIVHSINVRNGVLSVRTNEEGGYKALGNIKEDVQEINESVNGRIFDFEIVGSGQDDVQIIGMDFNSPSINLSTTD